MKTQMVAIGMIAALSGCAATRQIDPELAAKPGATITKDERGDSYLRSVRFDYQTPASSDDALQYCITTNVDNRGIALSGESSSYVSPFTGIRYSNRNTRETGGGQVISFVSDDGSEVVANGMEPYQTTFALVTSDVAVRYQLEARSSSKDLSLIFGDLERAWSDTGASENLGFRDIGAWGAAGGVDAYDALRSVAEGVRSCMASR